MSEIKFTNQEVIETLAKSVDSKTLLNRPLSEWRNILVDECGVYVFGENYLGKRFDHIHFQFCEKNEATEILTDNLYALLRYKYFPILSEEVDDRIKEIISNFTANLKTSLKRVSFENDNSFINIQIIPNYCIAFRNGVYDFKNNKWFFNYNIVKLEKLHNEMYLYDNRYIILWYLDFDFEPLPININTTSINELIEMMKELVKDSPNYCFELMYNMSHNEAHNFSYSKFVHLCEVMGYMCCQSLLQHFILLVGTGGNGKNSLFDGCFSNRVFPRPANNDLFDIEEDKFITGSLENRGHNIYLESTTDDDRVYKESKRIKNLTGSNYQTIEKKGVNKYSGFINTKFLFAANDQDKIKFSDTSDGFMRRINVFEIYYKWDNKKRFLDNGDYYDTTFSDDLHEIKNDLNNSVMFVYFAMYGLSKATNSFTSNFKFEFNNWRKNYSNVDFDLRDSIEDITLDKIIGYMRASSHKEECKTWFFDVNKDRLYLSDTIKEFGYKGYEDLLKMFKDEEFSSSYFSEYDVYISTKALQLLIGNFDKPVTFSQQLKKIYRLNSFEYLYNNKSYVKISFINRRLKIVNRGE